MLLDVAAEYLDSQSRILDIGCRDARCLIRLVQAHDCGGVGFDPVDRNLERARAAEYGQERYDLAQASLQWLANQMLGKLQPVV